MGIFVPEGTTQGRSNGAALALITGVSSRVLSFGSVSGACQASAAARKTTSITKQH
jgi:hypothetical protein